MIFHRLGLINRNQMGFTLIELMLAIVIAGIITGGITTTIFSVVNGNIRTSNHMTAVRQVQSAGYWVSHDSQMAQSIIFDDPATSGVTEFLTLTWTYWDTGDVHRVAYTLENVSGSSLKNLQRSHSINGGTAETSIIAQFIDPDLASCDFTDNNGDGIDDTLVFTVTATVQEQAETRIYEVIPRPSS